jgi:hypothetical protein
MKRLLVNPSVMLTVLFALTIGVIRAQPHDDSAVRALLSQMDACTTRCLAGIQVGNTTVNETITRLRASGWIENVRSNSWSWTGAQPDYIQTPGIGMFDAAYLENVIEAFYMQTTIPSGDIRLLLGKPKDIYTSVSVAQGKRLLTVLIVYPPQRYGSYLYIEASAPCPAAFLEVWQAPTFVGLINKEYASQIAYAASASPPIRSC